MPMLCIAGTFRVTGSEPDGDSIHFVPSDPELWKKVESGPAVRVNAHGGAQLRFDGIDALETHYKTKLHQPLALAHGAAEELLKWLGFRQVARAGEKITSVATDDLPGFIFTRTADKYGRCVALVGRGKAPAGSGKTVSVTPALLRKTAM